MEITQSSVDGAFLALDILSTGIRRARLLIEEGRKKGIYPNAEQAKLLAWIESDQAEDQAFRAAAAASGASPANGGPPSP